MTAPGNTKPLTRLFGLMAAAGIALVASFSGAAPAAAASGPESTARTVNATDAAKAAWCTYPGLGGQFYCGSDIAYQFPNGIRQVFVVGTNASVYTRWELSVGGSWAPWYSLGGKVAVHNGVADGVDLSGSGYTPTIWVGGTVPGDDCYRTRQSNGNWTGWACV